MPFRPGSFLGPYEIDALIGAGGMGEVYRARDTRLNRSVAVKVLPEMHAGDADFRSRFEREARTVAALSHPHICTVYDVGRHEGSDYLVMELIEGTTLASRLERQRLGLDEALVYAIQIADALERAHGAGVVHRDLKPGNVMVTKSGVKLLDFGLAKMSGPAMAAAIPTSPAHVTAPGTILGTLQYMAPEQVEGGEADARTDIFAFGVLVFEMITGRKAFEGKNAANLMGAILRDQPPLVSTLQPQAPRALDRVVLTCLAKDPADRWQSARDLGHELQWIVQERRNPSAAQGTTAARSALSRWLVGLVAAAAAIAGVLAGWALRPGPAPPAVTRWAFSTVTYGNSGRVAISRDAQAIVYEGLRPDGVQQLYSRRRDELEAVPIRGTDGASQLALSPDAAWVLFVAGRHLVKVPFAGGPVTGVCEVPASLLGVSWGPKDQIVFGTTDGLYRVPATGGTPVPVTRVDASKKESAHGWPIVLADGETIVFTISRATVPEVSVTNMAGDTPRTLVRGTHPRMTAAGDLLFTRGSTVWATRYDASFSRVLREPVPVLEGVDALLSGYTAFDVAPDGTLIYRPRRAQTHQLTWVDRNGRTEPATSERFDGVYHGPPALSPDGKRLALSRHPTNGVDQIAIYDLERGSQTIVPGTGRWPVWTRDGSRLAFASERQGSWDVFEVAASGVGTPQPLLVEPRDQVPWSWAPGSQTLAYTSGQVNAFDIWFLPRGNKPFPLPTVSGGRTPVTRLSASVGFSPDGRWIVYHSDESGRAEVYLQAFPGSAEPIRVSTDGGRDPAWSRDGREILYVAGDNSVMSVGVQFATAPTLAKPVELFRLQMGNDGTRAYDVALDGRLLTIQDLNTTPAQIVVVEHWPQELERLFSAR